MKKHLKKTESWIGDRLIGVKLGSNPHKNVGAKAIHTIMKVDRHSVQFDDPHIVAFAYAYRNNPEILCLFENIIGSLAQQFQSFVETHAKIEKDKTQDSKVMKKRRRTKHTESQKGDTLS